MLNNNRKQYHGDHAKGEEAEGRSATTLHWCLQYVRRYRPQLILAENITNVMAEQCGDQPLDTSVLDYILQELGSLGYVAVPMVLHADYLGSAAKRKRLYLVACLCEAPRSRSKHCTDLCMEVVETVKHVAPKHLIHDILYARSHHLVQEELALRYHELQQGTRSKTQWEDHDAIFRAEGFQGERDAGQLLRVTSLDDLSIQCLIDRQRDVLLFVLVVKRRFGVQPPGDVRVWDLLHSLKFLNKNTGMVNMSSTVCPNSTLFVYGGMPVQNRILIPREHFRLLGYDMDEMGIQVALIPSRVAPAKPTEWHWHELTDLIGNAFDSYSFLTALLAAFALIVFSSEDNVAPVAPLPSASSPRACASTSVECSSGLAQEAATLPPSRPNPFGGKRGSNPFAQSSKARRI